jgi:hypothetical protein
MSQLGNSSEYRIIVRYITHYRGEHMIVVDAIDITTYRVVEVFDEMQPIMAGVPR